METEYKPADLEVMIRKKTEVEVQELKPKFLSKSERRQEALKNREERVRIMKDQNEAERKQRILFFEEVHKDTRDRGADRELRDRGVDRELRDRGGDRESRDRGVDRDRFKQRGRDDSPVHREEKRQRTSSPHSSHSEREKNKAERAKDKEREEIKKCYMGIKEKKKRFVKPSEKFKFVFEWDLGEDTSRDNNPLYNNPLEPPPQFGRGFIGGIDKRDQIKKYKETIKISQKEAKDDKGKYDKQLSFIEKMESIDRHWTDKKLSEMTPRDWRIFKEDHNITTKGGGIPHPIRSWSESELPDWILNAVKESDYKKPSPVQMQAIPIGLSGRDILGVAETGSGKTAAFVLPMLVHISNLPKMTREIEADGPYAVVLAPARELASQIQRMIQKFAKYSSIRTVLIVGGQPIEEQAMELRKGCEIIVATPGRLIDCIELRYVVLNQCNYIVLDEADRMIDMGFEQQVVDILDSMPRETLKSDDVEVAEIQEKDHRNKFRTTLMFSATMPPEVERLSRNYLRRPGIIYIGDLGQPVDRIKQVVLFVKSDHEKKIRLEQLLRDGPSPPIIIFVNQRKTCDTIAKYLNKMGYRATMLQGGKSQDHRDWSLSEFIAGRYDILVATDIASRGLDIKGITHVINYDLPNTIQQYIHRIGRTARAGEFGLATSFLTMQEDPGFLYDLKKTLLTTDNPIPQELLSHPDTHHRPGSFPTQTRRDTIIYAS